MPGSPKLVPAAIALALAAAGVSACGYDFKAWSFTNGTGGAQSTARTSSRSASSTDGAGQGGSQSVASSVDVASSTVDTSVVASSSSGLGGGAGGGPCVPVTSPGVTTGVDACGVDVCNPGDLCCANSVSNTGYCNVGCCDNQDTDTELRCQNDAGCQGGWVCCLAATGSLWVSDCVQGAVCPGALYQACTDSGACQTPESCFPIFGSGPLTMQYGACSITPL